MVRSHFFVWALLLMGTVSAQVPKYQKPITLDDGWTTSDLGSLDIDTTLIHGLFDYLYNQSTKIHSLLVVKDYELIIEHYLNGGAIDQPHDLRSTTKSIRAILMGIAIDKGFIEDVHDPISKYVSKVPKKNLDPKKEDITLHHLLTMSGGWDCNDWDKLSKGREDKVYKKKDWIQFTLDLPLIHNPGSVSNYCSMGAIIIAQIIGESSNMTIDEFASQHLFQPMAITNYRWGHTSEKEVIPAGKRLYMTTRDMAKIGQLVLDGGVWKGKQIVSPSWIYAATTTMTSIGGMDYGYFWWNIPLQVGGEKVMAKTATGNGGQYIFVIPEFHLVAVFTGGAYNSQEDKLPFAIMQDIILPTFRDQ